MFYLKAILLTAALTCATSLPTQLIHPGAHLNLLEEKVTASRLATSAWHHSTGGTLGELIGLLNTHCPEDWYMVGGFAVYLHIGEGTYDDLDISVGPDCMVAVRSAVFGAAEGEAAEHLPEMHDDNGDHEVTLLPRKESSESPDNIDTLTCGDVGDIRTLPNKALEVNYLKLMEIKYIGHPSIKFKGNSRGTITKNEIVKKMCKKAAANDFAEQLPKDVKRLKRVWALRSKREKHIPTGELTTAYNPCEAPLEEES